VALRGGLRGRRGGHLRPDPRGLAALDPLGCCRQARRAPHPRAPHAHAGRRRHAHRPAGGVGRRPVPPRIRAHVRVVRAVRGGVRRHRDPGHRHARRPAGGLGPGQGGRPGLRRVDPRPGRRGDVLLPRPVRRLLRALAGPGLPGHRPLGGRHGQRGEPDRRPRRAGRRRDRHRRRGVLRLLLPFVRRGPALARQHGASGGRHHLRHLCRVPAPQLPSGQGVHGRQRVPPARSAHGRLHHLGGRAHGRPVQRPDLLLLRPSRDPVRDPGGPVPRHRPGHRAASPPAGVVVAGRQGAPPPPPHAPGPRPDPLRHHPVGVDGHPVRGRPAPDLHQPGQRRRALRGGGAGRAALHAVPPRRAPDRPSARGGGRLIGVAQVGPQFDAGRCVGACCIQLAATARFPV
ncbi:MAG: Undecaprenyl-phosphate alpha-N-acetylglucosaminyl 1-phosphate transferase, partial [uncultured Acidimicrobiales bacterium]